MPPGNGTAQATITFCSNVGGQSGSTGWASPQLDMNLLLQAPTTGTGGTPTFTSTSLATQSMTLYEAVVIPTDGHVVAGIQVTDCYGIASGAGTYCGVIFSSFGSPTQNPTLVFQSSSGTPISSTLCP
jgi:hypothetical protein